MIETDVDLSELLEQWWLAEHRVALLALGLPRECPSTRGYRSAAVWDADNGVDDAHVLSARLRAVDGAIDALPRDQRAAVHVLARNLALGMDTWTSALLPADTQARQQVFVEAVTDLARSLGLTGHDLFR